MNKIVVSLLASLAIIGVVVAQVPGGFQGQEVPRPAGVGQGGMRAAGGGVAVTCNEKFLFVVTNGTVIKYDVATMVKLSETKLPTTQRKEREN